MTALTFMMFLNIAKMDAMPLVALNNCVYIQCIYNVYMRTHTPKKSHHIMITLLCC